MENVLTASIIIFLLMFTTLNMSMGIIASQDTLQMSRREAESRWAEQARTDMEPLSGSLSGAGNSIDITLLNSGDIALAGFEQWDVIVQYTGAAYHIQRLSFASPPIIDEWGVSGIYLDGQSGLPEAYEKGIWNPGEELVLRIRLAEPLATGATALITVATTSGVSTAIQVTN